MVLEEPGEPALIEPTANVPKHIQTGQGRLLQRAEDGVLTYQFGRIVYGVETEQPGRFVPVLVDGRVLAPDESMYAVQVKLDPAEIEVGKVYTLGALSPRFQLSWRESHVVPSGAVDCPAEVEVNHERDTVCGINWITHTLHGGERDEASLQLVVNEASPRRLSMALEMDAFGKRLSANDPQKRYCCALATIDVNASIDRSGRFNATVDPFVEAYHCRYSSIEEALGSGCPTIERN